MYLSVTAACEVGSLTRVGGRAVTSEKPVKN